MSDAEEQFLSAQRSRSTTEGASDDVVLKLGHQLCEAGEKYKDDPEGLNAFIDALADPNWSLDEAERQADILGASLSDATSYLCPSAQAAYDAAFSLP